MGLYVYMSNKKGTLQNKTIFFHLEQSKNKPLYVYMPNKKGTLQNKTILFHLEQSKNKSLYVYMPNIKVHSKIRQFFSTWIKAKISHYMFICQIKKVHSKTKTKTKTKTKK